MAARYTWFKAAVFALLVCNTTILLSAGTASEALDAVAWLVLLASFELETGYGGRFRAGRKAAILRGARLVAAAAIAVAAIGYVRGEEWLDAIEIDLFRFARRVTTGSPSG